MPLYEYECTLCSKHTEKIQKFSDPEITDCPFCGGPLDRVLSAPAISFKGGGWYADGYASAKPPASGSSSEGNGGSEAAKPAAQSSGSAAAAATAAPAPAPTPAPSASPATPSASTK
jgi:putative FmdB family regulatory protein